MKTLNWKPVIKGRTYCSTACGHGCTLASYRKAVRDSESTRLKMKTAGWQTRVWENMGWHWMLTNRWCGMSLHRSAHLGQDYFWCMMADGDSKECCNGSYQIASTEHVKNPNEAVEIMVKTATKYFAEQARGFDNLKQILK